MKVIVNITPLTHPLTGIGRYTYHILQELIEHPDVTDIKGISASGLLDKTTLAENLKKLDHSYTAITPLERMLKRLPGSQLTIRALTYAQAVRHRSKLSGWVYWETGFSLLPLNCPSIATIYDLSHARYPEYHPPRRVWLLNKMLPKTLSHANRILTISQFTRDELITLFNPKQPIDIAYPGVSSSFFNIEENEIKKCRDKYSLPNNFILSVGTLEPRKNLTGLVQAFQRLPKNIRQNFPLVIAGGKGWQDSSIKNTISQLDEAGEALILGYIDQDDIPALYASASAMAYVSYYEGFGMPIAEAMAAGTPVLTSDTTSMPEVAANSALTANPRNTEQISEKLLSILRDNDMRLTLSQKGKQRALNFTWQAASRILIESLKQLKKKNQDN